MKRKRLILTIGIYVVAAVLGSYLSHRIYSAVRFEAEVARIEGDVIGRLVQIREAQKAYHSTRGVYAASWDVLLSFVAEDSLYTVERKETIIPQDYGVDSIEVVYDTLGVVSVMDSLFSPRHYDSFSLDALPIIPHTSPAQKFDLWTGEIFRGGVPVAAVEVRDVAPVNPSRSEDNELRGLKPLRFGSKNSVTLSGNWE